MQFKPIPKGFHALKVIAKWWKMTQSDAKKKLKKEQSEQKRHLLLQFKTRKIEVEIYKVDL